MKEKIESLERKILLLNELINAKIELIGAKDELIESLKMRLGEYPTKPTGQPLPNFHLRLVKRANES